MSGDATGQSGGRSADSLDPERRRAIEAELRRLRAASRILDDAFPIPGTGRRVGLDPVVGLVPVAGDLVTGLVTAYLVLRSLQLGVPRVIALRMVVNTVIDIAIGVIPLLGDLFDFAWKANARNLRLFEAYAADPRRSTRESWEFLVGLGLVLVGSIALAVYLAVALLDALLRAFNAR